MNPAWGRLAFGPPALGLLGLLARSPETERPIQFVDVTEEVGLTFRHEASSTAQKYLPETMAPGVALFDADGDGRLDIFIVNGARILDPMPAGAAPVKDGPRYWHRLYRQKEDGRFEDATEAAGLTGVGYGMGVAVGDYDNDGDADLYVTALGGNRLYRNAGRARFQDVTDEGGVAASGWSASAAFVDFDHDGRLDLFVCRYLAWSFDRNPYCGVPAPGPRAYCHPDQFPGITNLLYRNEGNGRFTDVSLRAGVANPEGKSLGVALADYDGDGLTDLFVANDSVRQFLYRNLGDGRFEDVALKVGAGYDQDGRAFAGMGVDFSDYDNDGRPDVVITNLSNERYALYRNSGDGSFTYETFASGLGAMTLLYSGWGVRFLDYDNDGWRDLLLAQGHVLDTIEKTSPHIRYRQPPLLARNEQGRFRDVSPASGEVFQRAWAARGLATGDLDGDGDLDAVVTTVGGRAYVLRNEGGTGHFLRLRLIGHLSNRDGIGAEIRLVTAAGKVAHATVTRSGSYLSASEPVAHLGLGAEREARTIDIRWPSGIVQRLRDVAADQVLTVEEPEVPGRR